MEPSLANLASLLTLLFTRWSSWLKWSSMVVAITAVVEKRFAFALSLHSPMPVATMEVQPNISSRSSMHQERLRVHIIMIVISLLHNVLILIIPLSLASKHFVPPYRFTWLLTATHWQCLYIFCSCSTWSRRHFNLSVSFIVPDAKCALALLPAKAMHFVVCTLMRLTNFCLSNCRQSSDLHAP